MFGLQAVLAWLVSAPLLAAQLSAAPLERARLARPRARGVRAPVRKRRRLAARPFQSCGDNRDRVLDRGLWRYSRHPNYFGECCVWWGIACFGLAAGGFWSLVSPLLMTFLLLRVSGVTLLEQSIGDRRPGYADYVRRTSAFIPLPPRKLAVNRAAVDL